MAEKDNQQSNSGGFAKTTDFKWLGIGLALFALIAFIMPMPDSMVLKAEELFKGQAGVDVALKATHIKIIIALLSTCVIFFATEAVPMPAVALLIGLVQLFFGITDSRNIVGTYAHDAVWFIAGSLALGATLVKYGLDKRVGMLVINLAGTKTRMIVIGILLLISLIYINIFTGSDFSIDFVKEKNPQLLSLSYVPSYTAGLTFFIAVAATNLFHQGNWQRVYAAKNFETLKKSLVMSFFIIVPVVFFMGFTGMVAFSLDPTIRPDLGFFTLLLKEQTKFLSFFVIVLGLALTISTVDTLVNAISSLIVVDGNATFNLDKKKSLNFSKYIILFLSLISFIIASKGFDILYLFLLADLFCCAFVLTVFYSFYNKHINEKTAYVSIFAGLIGGFLMFPAPDFSKSLLVGVIFSKELFAPIVSQSLLFLSFIIATFLPFLVLKAKRF